MKNIRRKLIFAAAYVVLMIALFAGCANNEDKEEGGEKTLEEIVEQLYADVYVPAYETVRLNETNFQSFAFVPYDDSLSAVAADALVNITPHSVVVIKADDGNGAELAEDIILNADPNKWLCVGSETVNVAYTDHYVVLVMSDKATAEGVTDNFKAMAKKLDGMEMSLLSTGNSRYEE